MHVWIHGVLVLGLVLSGVLGFAGVGEAQETVLLNEIMADPAGDWDGDTVYNFRDDEWVEIVNAGTSTVSLDGYRISSPDTTWRYAFSGSLAPGEVKVVYGSQSYAWESANGEPLFGLRLANTGGEVLLWKVTDSDAVIVDRYVYQDHEAEDDRSSGRLPDGGPDWYVFDSRNAYSGSTEPLGSGCDPTPGTTVFCPLDVEPRTWGSLKNQYRVH